MTAPARFPFVITHQQSRIPTYAPYLPITLAFAHTSLASSGLLDTGAAINVLPHDLGRLLGAVWEDQPSVLQLVGNLGAFEARAIILSATVGGFPPVRLAFAWTQAPEVPLILGQVNFFQEFDVCFFRSRAVFEVKPK